MNLLRSARARFALALLVMVAGMFSTEVAAQTATPRDLHIITPCRVVDSRITGGALATGGVRDVNIPAVCGIPDDVVAIIVNLTVVSPPSSGYIQVFKGATTPPTANVLTFDTGDILGQFFVVEVGTTPDLQVRLVMGPGSTHFVIDVLAYHGSGAPSDIALSNNTVLENEPVDTLVGTLSTTDPDFDDTHSYELVDEVTYPDNLKFKISGDQLLTNAVLDREAQQTYSIRVRSTDNFGVFSEEVFTIEATNENEAPTDIALDDTSVADGDPANTLVGTFSTTDVDTGDTHTYTLVAGTGSDDNASFTISGNELRTVGAVDFEAKTSYKIRVRSTDAGTLFFEKEITITVNDGNEAPTDLSLSPSSVAENQTPPPINVGTFSAIDPDAGDSHTYTLVSGVGSDDNASFDIVGGQLRALASFDRETKSSYTIRVRTTDSGGLFHEEPITITVDNVNEVPTNLTLSNTTLEEDQPGNTLVGTFSTTDPDTGDSHTYSFAAGGADNAAFTISGNELRTVGPLDFESRPAGYAIRIRTTDAGGLFFEKDLTITTINVNEDPTDLALSNATLAENQPGNTLVGTFSTTDPDTGDSHTYTFVAGGADNGAFTISGNELRTVGPLDFESRPAGYAIRVRTTDAGGLFFEKDLTIATTNVNEDPANLALSPSSVAENQAANTLVGTLSTTDPDTGDSHSYSFAAGGADNGSFTISGNEIRTVPSFDFEADSSYTIRVRTTDSGGLFFEKDLTISITNVNEVPTDLALSGPLTVNENSPVGTLIGNLSTVDPDVPDNHTYTLVGGAGSTHNNFFQIVSGNQLQLLLVPNYEANQSLSVRVRTTDAGGLNREESFTISVVDLNEPPTPVLDTYTAFGNTQLAAGGLAGTHRSFSTDPDQLDANDTDPDTLTPEFRNLSVIAASGATTKGGTYSIAGDGSFTYQPPVGYVTTTANPVDPTGPDTFSYSLTDGTNIVSGGAVQITVNHRIWYVHNNPGTAGNAGDSADPVDTLLEAETKSGPNDYIYVFEGNGSNTGMNAGITLKDGQKLLGEALDLVVAGTKLVEVAEGTKRPEISDSNDTVSVLANTANGNRSGIEIRGLQLSSTGGSAIDLTSANATTLEATVQDVVITGTGALQEGIDVNAGSTGTTTVSVSNASLAATGNAFDARTSAAGNLRINFSNNANILSNASGVVIDGSGGGVTTITGFSGNSVSPNTAGTGISVTSATFDSTPGAPYNTIAVGAMVIGASGIGNGVGGSGLVMTNVQGDLSFTDLDIYADGGAGLQLSGSGPVNIAGGTGTRATVGAGVGIIEAIGGAAVDVSNATIDLQLTTLKSTNSTSKGVSLTNVSDGTTDSIFSAGSGSSITTTVGASGPAFSVSGGNARVTYAGTITSNGGRAVLIDSWSGDDVGDDLLLSGAIDENGAGILVNANSGSRAITFSGGMDIDTGANEGFSATSNTNSGGLHITGTNTVDTTTATALRVTNTQIGNSGLTFRSITAGTGSGSNGVGIVLDSTGTGVSNGGLTVTGNGSAGTGGTIQHKTGADGSTSAGVGIFLNNTKNVSLSWMQLNDFDNSAIAGRNVQGFTLQNSVINGTIGTTNVGSEGPIMFGLSNPGGVNGLQGTGLIRNTKISGGVEHNLEFYNQSGSMNLTIAGINAVSEGANPNSPADDVADCIIEENSVGLGGDGIQVEMQGTSTASVVVDRCLFRDNKSQAIQVSALNSSSVTLTIDESRARRFDQGNEGFILQNGGDADLTTIVSNNHINGFGGTAIFAGQVAGNATAASELNVTISGNTITQPTTATNHAIITFLTSTVGQLSQARVRIDGNNVTNNSTTGTTRGILVDTPDTSTTPVFHATVTNNTVSVGDNIAGVAGIVVQGRQSSDVCASIGGNTVTFPNGTPAGVLGLRARQTGSAVYDLEQSASCTGAAAAVLACRNPGSTTEVLGTLTVVPTGACLLPNTP